MNPDYKREEELMNIFKKELERMNASMTDEKLKQFWSPNEDGMPDIDADIEDARKILKNSIKDTPVVKMRKFMEATTPIGTIIRLLSVTPIMDKDDEDNIDEEAKKTARYIGEQLIVEGYNMSGIRALAVDGNSISIAVGYDTYEIVRKN